MLGTVILVGAGPGDPGLLTIKGLRALEQAQVVVYDRLVGPEILALIPAEAEAIDVGKQAANHKVPQEGINQILLEKALEGKRVVRLKGGDPFLFGRGGEELELLEEHGVPFQVVPGITSAIAVPAYGGIPVTHRDFTSSLHIITGHQRAGRPLDIDFEALVRTHGTLVFLMGVTSLPAICEGLMAAGMDPQMPAAIVERGSTPAQRRVDATVGSLAAAAEQAHVESPAISIVGPVCALADRFDWFDRLPLKGLRIVVTRPRQRAGTLSDRLRALGADVLEYPCIETRPILPCPGLTAALSHLQDYEWLCFTSPAGVEAFRRGLTDCGLDARALGGVKLAAIGPGTARELEVWGLRADYIPEVYDAAHLGAGLARCCSGRLLILRAELGTPALLAPLDEADTAYEEIHVYRTRYENERSAELRDGLEAGEIGLVTFTSASTVLGFVRSVGEDFDFSKVRAACIGAQTAQAAGEYGMVCRVAAQATMEALTALIISEKDLIAWN
ncbi:MAG: uroporphyrinogen-III C-methyltransferase [Pseudoflavonifractor sp.]